MTDATPGSKKLTRGSCVDYRIAPGTGSLFHCNHATIVWQEFTSIAEVSSHVIVLIIIKATMSNAVQYQSSRQMQQDPTLVRQSAIARTQQDVFQTSIRSTTPPLVLNPLVMMLLLPPMQSSRLATTNRLRVSPNDHEVSITLQKVVASSGSVDLVLSRLSDLPNRDQAAARALESTALLAGNVLAMRQFRRRSGR